MLSRRDFLRTTAIAGASLTLPMWTSEPSPAASVAPVKPWSINEYVNRFSPIRNVFLSKEVRSPAEWEPSHHDIQVYDVDAIHCWIGKRSVGMNWGDYVSTLSLSEDSTGKCCIPYRFPFATTKFTPTLSADDDEKQKKLAAQEIIAHENDVLIELLDKSLHQSGRMWNNDSFLSAFEHHFMTVERESDVVYNIICNDKGMAMLKAIPKDRCGVKFDDDGDGLCVGHVLTADVIKIDSAKLDNKIYLLPHPAKCGEFPFHKNGIVGKSAYTKPDGNKWFEYQHGACFIGEDVVRCTTL